jgi:penicillin-binding protein 1B
MVVLKNILILVASIVFLCPALAGELNPFTLGDEFTQKLNSQALLKSTRFFARSFSVTVSQSLTTAKFTAAAAAAGYRARRPDQVLSSKDYSILSHAECQGLSGLTLSESESCYVWKNSDGQTFVTRVLQDSITQIFHLTKKRDLLTAGLDPVLVAQFRGGEPLLQEERKLADIPVQCLNAVMAIEDNEFLSHSGVSYTGLLRAIIKNITQMRKAQGGSTITQQLVKNYFLTPEKTLVRKAKELYMASRLESEWTKDQILETYLNIIYMGQMGAFQVRGFPAASRYYFDRSVDELNLAECALLAAIINNPGLNNPWKKTEKAKGRRELVLKKMRELQLISESEFASALQVSLPKEPNLKASETAPYFLEAVRDQAKKMNQLHDGYTYYTTLNASLQQAAQLALQEGIKNLSEARSKIKDKKAKGIELQGVVLAADSATGYVTVFVGGQSFRQTQFNRALHAQRQIGSLVKPFIYLTALTQGLSDMPEIHPLTDLKDEKFTWPLDAKRSWTPENYDKKFRGVVPFYYALKESLNSPTAQLAQQLGLDSIAQTLRTAGFTTPMELNPSLSLGTTTHYPFEVLQAYLTLSKLGYFTPLTFIEQIVDDSQNVIFEIEPKPNRVLDSTMTSVLVGIMKEATRSGTAKSIASQGFKPIVAGKTGTTSNGADVWFAGFSPHITTVVWLGYDQNQATSLTGASGAIPIWLNFMRTAQAQYPENADFSWPETVEKREVNAPSVSENPELIFKK